MFLKSILKEYKEPHPGATDAVEESGLLLVLSVLMFYYYFINIIFFVFVYFPDFIR